MSGVRLVTVEFDVEKAKAVHRALGDAITPLIGSGVVTNEESASYLGYSLGQLLAHLGVQYDTSKGFDPMIKGYVDYTQSQSKTKSMKGDQQ